MPANRVAIKNMGVFLLMGFLILFLVLAPVAIVVALVQFFLKKKFAHWLVAGIAFLVLGLIGSSTTEKPTATVPQETKQSNGSNASKEELSKITVRVEAQDTVNQDGKRKVVTTITNTAEKAFTGNVRVTSRDVDGKTIGSDVIFPENVAPGRSTFAISWMKVSSSPTLKAEVASGAFK